MEKQDYLHDDVIFASISLIALCIRLTNFQHNYHCWPSKERPTVVPFNVKGAEMEKTVPEVLSSVNSYLDAEDNSPEAILICFPLFNLVPCKHRVSLWVAVSAVRDAFFPWTNTETQSLVY